MLTAQDWQGSAGFRTSTLLGGLYALSLTPVESAVVYKAEVWWYLGLFNEGEVVPSPSAAGTYDEENLLAVGHSHVTCVPGFCQPYNSEVQRFKVKRKLNTNSVLVLNLVHNTMAAGVAASEQLFWSFITRSLVRGT